MANRLLKGALAGIAAGLTAFAGLRFLRRKSESRQQDRSDDDMAKETPKQRATVERVMHEYKEGDLKSGSGRKVKNEKQAVAIALSEAGVSREKGSAQNKKNAKRSESRSDEMTMAELYEEAKKRNIPGRSKMDKAELERALGR